MKPNYVIVGAPKSGTTSVFHWLADHPEVSSSNRKEVQYFMDRTSSVFRPEANFLDHQLTKYDQFFSNYQPGQHKVVLEATPGYIYQNTAIKYLAKALPETKFVFILREPVGRLQSVFRYFSQNRGELSNDITFCDFVDLIKKQAPELQNNEFLRDAILHGQYIDYLKRWEDNGAEGRMIILKYETLNKLPKEFMTNIANVMGISSDYYADYDFQIKNKTVKINNRFIHSAAIAISNLVPFGETREKLKSIYFKLNSSAMKKTPKNEDENILEVLKQHYQPYNNQLSRDYNLDLTDW